MTQPTAAPFTCSVAWVGEALHGDVNHPHINGQGWGRRFDSGGGSTTNQQLRPGPAIDLLRGQEPATAFAREFASPTCAL